jgi:hypothetical protein
MPPTLSAQQFPIHEQLRVVQARGSPTGYPLRHGYDNGFGQPGGRYGVNHQGPARTQGATGFRDRRRQVLDVLEYFACNHDIGRAGTEGQLRRIALDGYNPVFPSYFKGRNRNVQADMCVALGCDVRSKQAAAAADVDKDGGAPGRKGDQPGTRPGDPVQHREHATRAPPFRGQFVVLARVVANPAHLSSCMPRLYRHGAVPTLCLPIKAVPTVYVRIKVKDATEGLYGPAPCPKLGQIPVPTARPPASGACRRHAGGARCGAWPALAIPNRQLPSPPWP